MRSETDDQGGLGFDAAQRTYLLTEPVAVTDCSNRPRCGWLIGRVKIRRTFINRTGIKHAEVPNEPGYLGG